MIAEQLKVAFKQSYDLHIRHHGRSPAVVIMHNDTAAMLGSECNYLNFDKDSKKLLSRGFGLVNEICRTKRICIFDAS